MYKKSEQLLDRALKSIPLASQTFSKSLMQYPRGASPFFIEKGKGSKVWDVDGNKYIDFVNSLAAVTLGYCDIDVDKAVQDLDFIRLDERAFESSPSVSIDYALMEKSNNVVVVPLDAKWSDVGSWNALYDIGDKDNNGNVIKGNVIVHGTSNSYINANNCKVVAIGVDDFVIISTTDTTFVARKDKVHKIKAIVEKLKKD